MNKNEKHYPLDVAMPQHCAYAVRDLPQATVEQRERALNATHWNEFAFPSGMLTVDMLSDSGTTAMTNQQLATLFLGDEAYGRNTGYYVLLDTFRDIFERGGEKNWKKIIDLVRTDCRDVEKMMDEVYLCEYEGGLFNGGAAQMERPNAFIIQQGRAAESVLMEIVRNILAKRHPGKKFTIPSNGHFDTTEGNIKQMGSIPRNLYNKTLLWLHDREAGQTLIPDRWRALPPLLLAGCLALFAPLLIGGGESLIIFVGEHDVALKTLILLLAFKYLFAQYSTVASIPGGLLMPILCLGALWGRLWAELPVSALAAHGLASGSVQPYVLFGMVSYFAATVRAPLTGIVLVTEMSGTYTCLPGSLLAGLIACKVANLLHCPPVYDSLKERIRL